MPGASRLGSDVAGGMVVTGSDNVIINGSGAARLGDVISPHGDNPHNDSIILTASSTVFINGIPLAREGDATSCGHPLSGSDNVFGG